MKPKLICILFGAFFFITCQATCPHPSIVNPCSCRPFQDELYLECKYSEFGENAAKDMEEVMKEFRTYNKIWKLTLSGFNFEEITNATFEGLSINTIQITESIFSKKNTFAHLKDSLQIIEIDSKNTDDKLTQTNFYYLDLLLNLKIESKWVKSVPKSWTKNMPKRLQTLVINGGEVQFIDDHAFEKLKDITNFDMQSNQLTTVKRTMFPEPAGVLKDINLSGNKIDFIPKDFFTNMNNLKNVQLSNNKLKTLEKSTWEILTISSIITVSLQDNPFVCDGSMDWLRDTNLLDKYEPRCSAPPKVKGHTIFEFLNTADYKSKYSRLISTKTNTTSIRNSTLKRLNGFGFLLDQSKRNK